ncbi:Disease resistance protein [Quillaja saponaria]|uniref:Disease resistance protein n=1 Tax=Quillaja saponaria TaxID=32244 RepID=A0AAD7PNB4_QUISA|nr:Disease resistance protein [Quillaja saponaria]
MDKLRTVLEHQITPNSFSKVKLIEISDCAKLVTIFPSHLVRNFQNLETLKVKNCNSVEEIFDHRELQDEKTHANVGGISCHLRYLNLQGLPKLKYIWSGDPKGVFKLVQDLQSVEVEECKNLNYIFSAPVAKCLLQLEKLEIISCGVTKIVSEDEGSSGVVRFHFPQLKHIKLKSLPKIKSFYPEVMFTLECSMLKELDIDVFDICNEILLSPVEKVIVPKLESLCLGAKTTTILYLNDQFQDLFRTLKILRVCDCSSLRSLVHTSYSSTLFRNLHTLEIESCDGLINLVTFSTLKSTLVRLQNLSIRNCEKIEEIISSTGHQVQHVEDDEIAFNQLESLKLFCLPNLKCFSREKCTLKFPSLKEVIVVACPKLEVFSSGILVAPLLCGVIQNKYLEGEKRWEGDLSNTVKGMFIDMQEEMAKGFPNIIKHPLHKKHELLLARGTHGCDGCGEYRDGWSYFCGRCEFDLDPGCALEDSNKTTNESGNEQVEESNIRR